MIVTQLEVVPVYVLRPDWYYEESQHKYVMLRNIQFNVTMKCSGEHDLDETAANLITHAKIRLPDDDTLVSWTAPSLDSMSTTVYSRGATREGSDYITLPSAVYDWRVAMAKQVQEEPDSGVVDTWYRVTGRWKYYQGLFYGLTRRI